MDVLIYSPLSSIERYRVHFFMHLVGGGNKVFIYVFISFQEASLTTDMIHCPKRRRGCVSERGTTSR